jgi:hypothetical protein
MRFYDSTHFSPSKCPVVPGLIDAWIGIGVVIRASVLGDLRSDDRTFLLPAAGDDDFRALVGKSQRSSVSDGEVPPVTKTPWF